MKRLLHRGRRSGNSNRDDSSALQDPSSCEPRALSDSNLRAPLRLSLSSQGIHHPTELIHGTSVPLALDDVHNGGGGSYSLPSGWHIQDWELRNSDPLCITMKSSKRATVYTDAPIPRSLLFDRGGRNNNDVDYGPTEVYYFEVTLVADSPSSHGTTDFAIGLIGGDDTYEVWPGEVANSIGWGHSGLCINGRRFEPSNRTQLQSGEVIGCGVKLGGMNQVFFTWNGSLVVPPSPSTALSTNRDLQWYPVASFRNGDGDHLRGNFGMDTTHLFRWPGNDLLRITPSQTCATIPHQPVPTSTDSYHAYPRSSGPSSISTQSYLVMDELNSHRPLSSRSTGLATRSMHLPMATSSPSAPLYASSSSLPVGGIPEGPSYYAAETHRRDTSNEEHSKASATMNDPFHSNSSSIHQPVGVPLAPPSRIQSDPVRWSEEHSPELQRMNSVDRRTQRRLERIMRLNAKGGLVASDHNEDRGSSRNSPTNREFSQSCHGRLSMSLPPARSSSNSTNIVRDNPEPTINTDSRMPTVEVVVVEAAPQDEVPVAKEHEEAHLDVSYRLDLSSRQEVPIAKERAQALLDLSWRTDTGHQTIQDMLQTCKADQEKLQLMLSTALEEDGTVENLEELFEVNDRICSAINAGDKALKRTSIQQEKNEASTGPTIELLVENEDVFSLICMLRAPNEKRMEAALALMKFARENETIRNEIRSAGGMHSFLTLFRTKGLTDEVKVVSSLAVAYILPSFVMAAQTSSTICLRIVECLRFLVVARLVETDKFSISRQEMLEAASMGINVLWINAIQPLLLLESTKVQPSQANLALKPSTTRRMLRGRRRAGGSTLDQGLESNEIRELTELAVTLVTYLAKISDSPSQDPLDVGFNIVEQVCEVEAARPIAVREGLLTTLVDWIRSGEVEKVRPAASALRYLISIDDRYMAGWIHSQVVSEGAVGAIVKLMHESVGHDVRVAVAQMISALCVAPHTRAAVVEARCVGYLVALLYEHNSPNSEEIVRYAASALVQLAAGAMVRASVLSSNGGTVDVAPPEQRETVISDIIEGWAHGSFVQIAREHTGDLRSVSVEALRVLSEDTDQARKTRLELCGAGAAGALGKTLKDFIPVILPLRDAENSEIDFRDPSSTLFMAVKDVHEALCGLANIFEPQRLQPQRVSMNIQQEGRKSGTQALSPKEMLIKGCSEMVKSGGLECLIWISSLPYTPSPLSVNPNIASVDRMDLLDETCRLLANISPLLLSDSAASEGCTWWASSVYDALHGIIVRLDCNDVSDSSTDMIEIGVDALKGLGALARYEPLKIRIVDKSLPKLLALESLGGEENDLSNAAMQVLFSLGFTQDEITVQVAGNNPKLLVDWFCLQRALLLQAMARAEVRAKVNEIWQLPLGDVDSASTEMLMRQSSAFSHSTSSSDEISEMSEDNLVMRSLFENFTDDRESRDIRETIVEQYQSVYSAENAQVQLNGEFTLRSSKHGHRVEANKENEESLLKSHVYPLNDAFVEKDWILSHAHAVASTAAAELDTCPAEVMSERIEKLLDCCFPSRMLRNDMIPFNDFRPDSTFNFRALMMPQRRFFSFRREGQLLARLCDKQSELSDTSVTCWSLGFTNSTFAGEFVESLVQSLYLCPMITGLSFSRNADWLLMRDAEAENEGEEGGGLLANLAGSLPPWVSYLTFDNVLQDRDLRALVAIIDTMGKLSSGGHLGGIKEIDSLQVGQSQGKFSFLGIRNSPQISRETWCSLFGMLGKCGPSKRGSHSMPLSSLTILDLSGNKLGDDVAALVLELVHDKDSGCNVEQLDLSGNRIGRGASVVRVLMSYTEYYRYNQKLGVKMLRSGWKSSLHTLVLADNDLFMGRAGLEIFALLKHNALCLRFLDLSNNGLEGDTYQILASSLLKNTSLCHLDLSNNKFSAPVIDHILEHLNGSDTEKTLSFLLLENNTPPLSIAQRRELGKFLRKSRKNAILRMINEKEAGPTVPSDDFPLPSLRDDPQYGLDVIDEAGKHLYGERSFSRRSGSAMAPDDGSGLEVDEGDNMITVLFSAPLVFADEANKLHPFAKLDFDMERELLWQCMKEASRDIELSFDNAHHSRLLATLTKRCSCLHYSGHGHPHFLPFEDGMGGPNWLNVQDIKELLVRDGAAPFKFVFVSACHSGLAGETFASAGVPHVVCCQQEEELKDTAALAFTRSFYLALAVGNTVKESFEQGCKAVRATPNLKDPEQEMGKFVLLPKDGNHDVPIFRAKPVREWPKQSGNQGLLSAKSRRRSIVALGTKSSELGTRNMMQDDPSPSAPQFFVGREVDMYYLLTALLKMKKRLVNVLGEPGIGRSSLVCGLCHYINERASTVTDIQRIYFIKPNYGRRHASCRSLLKQLIEKLSEAGKSVRCDDDTEVEGMLDIISKCLKNDKALVVFDRTELLDNSDDGQDLPMILSTLLYDTKQVKVLLTGRNSLGQPSIGGQVEYPYKLGPLNFANSVRLFGNLCPHLHTPSERGLFFSELIRESQECSQLFPGDTDMSNSVRTIFGMIGDGIPAKIEKAAYSISKEDLNKLRAGGLC